METRFYLTESLNLPAIAAALVVQYQSQGFETQQLGTETQTIVQLRKESTLRAITGLNKALTISLERRQSGVLVTVGAQNWADQIVAGTVGLAMSTHSWSQPQSVRSHRIMSCMTCWHRLITWYTSNSLTFKSLILHRVGPHTNLDRHRDWNFIRIL